MDNQTGRSLQGYEIFDRIGSGGFGVVYRAYQSTLGREVALKIILPGAANRPEFIRRFQAEAQLIARLEHLHIVPLYDFWRDPGGAYLVMRWLKGGNLKQALEAGPFDLKAASLVLDQIASGLSYAHANGVIHRDMKPANILLDEEGNCYLTDFGIALDVRSQESRRASEEIPSFHLEILSPEQARNEPVTSRSDIYGLGLVLYEVLAGQPPFPGTSPVERLFKHLNDPLPAINGLHAEVRDEVNGVIQKATAKNPDHRYQDAMEIATAFRAAAKLGHSQPANVFEVLTVREQGILEQIAAGRTNREIAQELFVELSTVKWYVRQIYRKLGVRSRGQAVVRARESGLFSREGQPLGLADAQLEPTSASLIAPSNPYKGLRAFEVADAREFFGREALVKKLLDRLAHIWQRNAPPGKGRFLAVVGPSGSGKTSLIKAGLVPALMAGEINGSERWFIAQIEPGSRPLDQLEVALVRLAAERADDLRAQLERDQFGLVRAAGLILPHDGSELVLVVDQFEELFTLVQDESKRAHYLDLLSAAVLEPNSRVRVVIALRADFYDRPLVFPVFGELMRNCLETVLPLSVEELERAILGPAEQAGVTFEPGLVARIIEDVFYQPGALPMLQYALTELFEQREGRLLTQAAYQKMGGASGALAKRAEELYLEMNAHGRKVIQQIFLRLVNFSDEGGAQQSVYTRRRALQAELLGLADEELIDEILDTYSRYRLLSLDHEPTTRRPTVELAHEAILAKWKRLQRLLDESREDLYTQRRISALASEWEQSGHDPGYLLRSTRLDQFAGWAANTQLALTEAERSFLETSLLEREERQTEEDARRQREIETAHQLAETEARRAQEQVRTARRLRWLASGLAVFLIVAIGAAWFALSQQRIAQQNEASAEQNAVLADQNAATAVAARAEAVELADLRSRDAQVNQSLALAAQSGLALQASNLDLALALAWEANRIPDPPGRAQTALSEAAYAPGTIRLFAGHAAPVWSVAVSPDGRYGLSGDADGVIYLWDLETGEALRRLEGHQGLVSSLAFTPDGRHALSGSHDQTILYWDLGPGQIIHRLEGHQAMVNSVAISPDGRTAASSSGRNFSTEPFSSADNSVRLWDLQSGEELRRFDFFTDGVTGVDFTPDGHALAVATVSDGFLLLEVQSGKALVRPERGYELNMAEVVISPDGHIALTADDDTVNTWNLQTGEVSILGENPTSRIHGLALSPDGKRALSGAVVVIEWDLETGEQINRFSIDTLAVAYRPDGSTALIGSTDGTLRLLALESGAEIGRIPPSIDQIRGAAYSLDGRSVIIDDSGVLSSWELESEEEIWRTMFAAIGDLVFGDLVLSPDGKQILVSEIFGSLSLWDAASGEFLRRLPGDPSFGGHAENAPVYMPAFDPSGKFAISGAADVGPKLIYWDLETGKPLQQFETNDGVLGTAISPDGRTALSAEETGKVNWWDLKTGELIRSLEGHTNLAWSVAYVDDKTAISASDDGTMILWDLEGGAALRSFLGHASGIKQVALNPDKRLALSASRDGTAILWDVQTGEPLRRYAGHGDELMSVAWRPNGAEALTGGRDGQAIRWRIDADLDNFLDWVAGNRYLRALSCAERESFQVEPLCPEGAVTEEEGAASQPVQVSGAALLPPLPMPEPLTAAPEPESRLAELAGAAARGVNFGSILPGGGQAWEYAGSAGERLSIRVAADNPANTTWGVERQVEAGLLDPALSLYAPDGGLLARADDLENGVATDAYLDSIELPQTGVYRIEVRSYRDQTGGDYRLILADPRPVVFKAGLPTTIGLAIHPDGRTALVGVGRESWTAETIFSDNRIWVWDLATGEVTHRLEGHGNTPLAIAISPDGKQALSADEGGQAILWDLETWEEVHRFDNSGSLIMEILFLPDGQTALTASGDEFLSRWDLVSGERTRLGEGHGDWVMDLALSPDGQTAYSLSWLNEIRVWDLASGEVVAAYHPFVTDTTRCLAVSPDGSKLLVGQGQFDLAGNEIQGAVLALLDSRTGETLVNLEGHTAEAVSVVFSPDGRHALSGSRDQTVRLWDLSTGEQLAVFTGHTGPVWKVALSPDGLTGYSTSYDGSLRVWDLSEFVGGEE